MEGGRHLINTDVHLGYSRFFTEEVRCEDAVVPVNCDPLFLPFFCGDVMYRDCMGFSYSRKLAGVLEFVQCCCLHFERLKAPSTRLNI